MKLAASNIAWKREDDAAVAELLVEYGVSGVEIAPTAAWPEPLRLPRAALEEYRAWWEARGVQIVSMQALLFGKPELTLFGDVDARAGMLEHLTGMMDIAAALGAGPLVFGSPKNRAVGSLPRNEAAQIAVDFFRAAGTRAEARGVCLCMEPNPPAYDCDFVNTVSDGMALVDAVHHRGFGLHVDAGAMSLNVESVAETIANAARVTRHFHASEPFLATLGDGASDHAACADALRGVGYDQWVSMEMRAPADGLVGLRRALGVLRANYGA